MTNKYLSLSSFKINIISKNTIINLAKIFIAVGLLLYLISQVQYNQIILAVNGANFLVIGIVLILGVLNVYLQYSKWRLTCCEVLEVNDNSKAFRSLFYGFSAGIITPLRIGEYFGRAIEFKDKSIVQVTVATLVDKFFPLLIIVSFGSISSLFFIYFYFQVSIYIVLSLFVLIFTFFYLFVLLLLSKRFWDNILFSRLKSSTNFKSFFDKLKVLKRLDRNYSYRMMGISFLFYACILIQYALLVIAFSHQFDFFNYLWAAGLIIFTKTIIPPISLGELGIREGASVYFITQMSGTGAVGFNASIFLFIINLLIPALIGVGMSFTKK